MNLTRLFSSGRISELAGEAGKRIDIRMRTIGFRRNAEKHSKILNPETRLFFQKYADGVNAYIKTRKDTHHIAFKLAGIRPDPWTVEDSLTILYYMGWDSAGNIHAERSKPKGESPSCCILQVTFKSGAT
jgi:penicillin amidase